MADQEVVQPAEVAWRWTIAIPAGRQTIDAGAIEEWLHAHGHPDATVSVDELARVAFVNAADDPSAAIASFDGQPRLDDRKLRQARQRLRDVVQKVDSGTALTSAERDRAIRDLSAFLFRLTREP